MRSPIRLGVAVSTVFLIVVVYTIWGNSAYLRDRWQQLDIDGMTDDLTDKLMSVAQTENHQADIGENPGENPVGETAGGVENVEDVNNAENVEDVENEDGELVEGTPSKYIGFGTPAATVDHFEAAVTSLLDPDEEKNKVAVDDRPSEEQVENEAEEKMKEAQEAQEQEDLPDQVVVMGKLTEENTDWVLDDLPDWQHAIYLVDAPDNSTEPHTPMNKGREAMAYLTYIIDHYGAFPSVVAFIHSHRDKFWHSDGMPGRGNWLALRVLDTEFIQKAGYASLRCSLGPGCPAEVQPYREEGPLNVAYERNMTDVWEEFWPGTECPEIIAAPCCAQFAVSGNQIMQRSKEEYVKYRDWLMETDIADDNSGRIFEYLWHIIFGQEPVFCPDYHQCWRDVYGGKSYRELNQIAEVWMKEKDKAGAAKAQHDYDVSREHQH